MFGLLCGVLVWSCLQWGNVGLVILAYLALNLAYTFVLKHQPVIDIFSIAIGFILRVQAGAAAVDVPVSAWMFVTTLCLALYLASIKRRQELAHSGRDGRRVLKHYSVALVDRYAEMAATGTLLFYSLFVMTVQPDLAVSIPVVLYGLFRYWFVVEALEGGESPGRCPVFRLAAFRDGPALAGDLPVGAVADWRVMNAAESDTSATCQLANRIFPVSWVDISPLSS